MNDAAMSLNSIIDVNFLLINRIAVLVVTLVFFAVVLLLKRNSGQEIHPRVTAPIKLALFGVLLLGAEMSLAGIQSYRDLIEGIQTLVVLLCFAKLVLYLVVDVYLRIHTQREVPSFVRDTVRLVVYLTVGILSLRVVFKIDISTIVTTTTVLTAAIAFAMQSTLSNALSGFSIQTDKLMDRHNWISIPDKDIFGEIINVGFRYTTLRCLNNTLQMVPNSLIMQSVVTYYGNRDSAEKTELNIDIMLGYDMPPESAKELLTRVMLNDRDVLQQPVPVTRLKSLADNGIVYQMNCRIEDPSKRRPMQDNLYTQVWYAVTRAGYSFPFPHRQIVTSEAKAPFSFSREQLVRCLQGADLFATLETKTIEELAGCIPVSVFGSGEVIVRQGDAGSSLYIVLKGTLEVEYDDTVVGSIDEDSFFGEMSLLTGEPRGATVRVCNEVWLAEMTKAVLEPILHANPALVETMSSALAERKQAAINNVEAASAAEVTSSNREEYLQRLKQFFRL